MNQQALDRTREKQTHDRVLCDNHRGIILIIPIMSRLQQGCITSLFLLRPNNRCNNECKNL